MNPAIAVLFCCMAILAQGAVIIDPTIADITFNGGLSKPFGVRKMFGAAGPFNRLEKSKCIGEDCIFDPISNCIGVECNVLVENKVREMEVQKQLQDQMVLQNAQFVEQQQLLNEQKRLQQQRILTKEAGLIKQALEQETQMDEQRAFIDVSCLILCNFFSVYFLLKYAVEASQTRRIRILNLKLFILLSLVRLLPTLVQKSLTFYKSTLMTIF
nr:unnamed protein product [Callosobruchus analis]